MSAGIPPKRNALSKIICIASLVAINFTDSGGKCCSSRAKLVCASTKAASFAVAVAISFIFFSHIVTSTILQYSFYASSISGLAIQIIILTKRKRISKTLIQLYAMSNRFNPNGYIGNKRINFWLALHQTYIWSVTVFMLVYFFYLNWSSFKHIIVFPSNITGSYRDICTVVVLLSIMASFGIGFFIGGITLLFCDSVYIALSDIIRGYRNHLKKRFFNHKYDQHSLGSDIQALHSIANLVKKSDEALNIFALLLFALIVCGFYILIGVLTSKDVIFQSWLMVVFVFGNLITVLVIFYKLTSSGSRVYFEGKELSKVAIRSSANVIESSNTENCMIPFFLLLSNLKEIDMKVTGGGMFVIEQGLYLTVSGVVVTYGAILFQR